LRIHPRSEHRRNGPSHEPVSDVFSDFAGRPLAVALRPECTYYPANESGSGEYRGFSHRAGRTENRCEHVADCLADGHSGHGASERCLPSARRAHESCSTGYEHSSRAEHGAETKGVFRSLPEVRIAYLPGHSA